MRLGDQVIGDPATVAVVAMGASDVEGIARLMCEREVAVWWPDADADDFEEYLTHAYVTPFRIVAAHATVGFLQVYHANSDPFWVTFGVPAETFGLDLAIGVAAARDRGIGRKALRLIVERLFAQPDVVRVQIDPDPENARAIRAFRSAGFVAHGVMSGYEGEPMLYMTIEPPAAPGSVSARTSR